MAESASRASRGGGLFAGNPLTNPQLAAFLDRSKDMIVAMFLVATLVIMLYPLSSGIMDFLLAANITFALVLLLATITVQKPLDLSSFPSILLIATLFRLALNIATTRLILSRAPLPVAEGGGKNAAGLIIRTFGQFVTGVTSIQGEPTTSSVVIGIVIFTILVVIQFVVITKGATRIAEVAARFTLDAMPGKQMAIDADLNAGMIDEPAARRRREELRQLSDFYGAMDGASKFVRGDAIAGIIITIVNIAAGLVIGMVFGNMPLDEAATTFTTLTIGDGLVSQVPALLISISSGLIVTRSAGRANFGVEVMGQLFNNARSLGMAAIILFVIGLTGLLRLTPMPMLPMFTLAALCAVNWWRKYALESARVQEKAAEAEEDAEAKPAAGEERVEEYLHVDPMELEVGYGLVPLVDVSQSEQGGGGLLSRIQMIRQQLAQELGIIVPPIRIRDNIQLEPNEYVIKIQGNPVARGTAEPDRYLAMDSGMATEPVEGIETTEPAFGLPAAWITEANREYAERVGYTVVDAETVVATHLTEVIKTRSHDLLTREEVRRLLDAVREKTPNLVQEVVPDLLTIADVQKVLQNLLRERVSIRNMSVILEVLGDIGRRTKDPDILTEYCRNKMARWLCNEYAEDGKLYVVTLDPRLEDAITRRVEHTEGGTFVSLRPAQQQQIVEAVGNAVQQQLQAGHGALVLTSPQIRLHIKRMTEGALPVLAVMSYNEVVSEYEVVSLAMVSVELG